MSRRAAERPRRARLDVHRWPARRVTAIALAITAAAGAAGLLGYLATSSAAELTMLAVLLVAWRSGMVPALGMAALAATVTGPVAQLLDGPAREPAPQTAWAVHLAVLLAVAAAVVRLHWRVQVAERRTFDVLREQERSSSQAQAEREALQQELWRRTMHDSLTGLPNRTAFTQLVAGALGAPGRNRVGVLLLDIDGFKSMNDTLGHSIGDEILTAIAQRLHGALRQGDRVARLAGDEFAILLHDLEPGRAAIVSERITKVLATPFSVAGQEITVQMSTGLAIAPDHAYGAEEWALELLRRADVALATARTTADGRAGVFDPGMEQRARERMALEKELTAAIEREELYSVFQPIIGVRSGLVESTEALVRWRHPERGAISPGDFIPLAERTGSIVPLGLQVLYTAGRQLRLWHEVTQDFTLGVAVNLSAVQIAHPNVVDAVASALFRSGVDPRLVTLEITESLVVEHTEEAVGTLWRLRGLGIGLAIDDFGTGYSSLSRLSELPVDKVKIDRSFVAGIGGTSRAETIISAAVAMAHGLGLSVVAEGVESEEQLAFLASVGCDQIQGFLIARPMPGDEVTPLLGRKLIEPYALMEVPRPRPPEEPRVPRVMPSLARRHY